MDLVLYQVVQLQHVGHANGDRSVELLAALPVAQRDLAVGWEAGRFKFGDDLLFGRAVKDWRGALQALLCKRPAEVRLKQLANVHAARHAERIEDDVNRGSVWEEWHVLNWEDA